MFAICFVVPYFSGKRLLFVFRVPIFLKSACYFVWCCVFVWKVFAILFVVVYFLVVFYKQKSKRMNCGKPILNVFKTYFELIGKTGSEARAGNS